VADDAAAAKEAAARHAVRRYVRPGMRLALGTGTTAEQAVRAIAASFPPTSFDCVSSSLQTEELARTLGLPVRAPAAGDRYDLMLDGADEVTPELALTKGGGGALLREKFLAQLARKLIVLVDPSKLVATVGERSPIPVEVVPFARPLLARAFADDGYEVVHRVYQADRPYQTDNGNEILDLRPRSPIRDPAAAARALRARVGVVEVGIFVRMAHRVVVGFPDGHAEERSRRSARARDGAAGRRR